MGKSELTSGTPEMAPEKSAGSAAGRKNAKMTPEEEASMWKAGHEKKEG